MTRMFAVSLLCALLGVAVPAQAAPPAQPEQVIAQFQDEDEGGVLKIPTRRKHEIMFWMGIALVVMLLGTVSLGVAMAAFGKDVFLWHMILGGLTAALALAHAATAIAWFWPY